MGFSFGQLAATGKQARFSPSAMTNKKAGTQRHRL
jgi:hypothetical protein